MELAIDGFVRYGLEKREVEVLPKTTEYILNNSNGRDYDVIRFLSSVGKGMNAMVSLLDFDMEVWGVRTIALSDSQKVALYPESQKVLIHKNLNFDFDGRIEAGRFTFYSRQNKFDYKLFRFNMPVIDSMKFSVPSFKLMPDGTRPLVRVRNTIENISGELLIDNPSNKSSVRDGTSFLTKEFNGIFIITLSLTSISFIKINRFIITMMNPESTMFSLQFVDFEVERYFDEVRVYDCWTPESSYLLLEADGNVIPRDLTSTTNRMLVTFKSDFLFAYKGFKVTWSSGKSPRRAICRIHCHHLCEAIHRIH